MKGQQTQASGQDGLLGTAQQRVRCWLPHFSCQGAAAVRAFDESHHRALRRAAPGPQMAPVAALGVLEVAPKCF